MSTTAIRLAAYQRLDEFTYAPQPVVMWPGISSEPPGAGMWLQPDLFPNEPEDISWNNDGCIEIRGFFQVLVHYRPGQGQKDPVILADALITHFPKGLVLGPARVYKRPWQSAPVADEDDLFVPVTIPYRGLT